MRVRSDGVIFSIACSIVFAAAGCSLYQHYKDSRPAAVAETVRRPARVGGRGALARKRHAFSRADGVGAVKHWTESRADTLARTKSFLAELERTGDLSVEAYACRNSQIHELAAR